MKISVIIPTYKPQDYLWECLDSMVIQTFPKGEFEVILVLNGCTEPYKSAIEKYIAEKMNGMSVNFIHTEVGGVSNARNLALDQVKGEFVTFIDDDDFVSPQYLELLYEKADTETISLCYPYAFNDGDADKQISYYLTDVYNELHKKNNLRISSKVRKYFSGPCMKLIPKSFIQDRRFDTRFSNGEDSLFMFLISDRFKYVNYTSKDAIYYRRYRTGSAVTSKRKKMDIIQNGIRLFLATTRIWINSPFKYNFRFYLTRCLGFINGITMYCLGKV